MVCAARRSSSFLWRSSSRATESVPPRASRELRRGVGVFSLFVQGIILGGVLLGLLHAPRRTLAAWRAGRSPSGAGLHPCDPKRYASLLGRSVGELRALYDVPNAGITGARELHYAAPSRQG